jgi:excinuclease ABC subunit A
MLAGLSRRTGIPIDLPFEQLSVSQRRILFRGTGKDWIEVRQSDSKEGKGRKSKTDANVLFRFQFKGFYPALDEASRLTPGLRGKLEKFTDEIDCGACDGSRLREESSAVRYRNHTIADLVHMPLDRLAAEVKTWNLDRREKKIAGELVREIQSRIGFLLDVGLDYLTLHRGAATLSGGEAQRIRLAGQLGSGLCGVLYVLDEPTIGLHPRDNAKLLNALHRLRDTGNTLLVVEHDRDVISGSDYLCDFGPGAGRHGGRIVAEGPPDNISPLAESITAGYINGGKAIAVPKSRRPVFSKSGTAQVNFLKIHQARENNLQAVDFELPLGVFTAITGPSGSGKSSLIDGILYPALARRLHRARLRPGRHEKLEGVRYIDKVIRVDQSSLGNSPSSNPATYTGAFDLIRQAFADLSESWERHFTARTFSFNVSGGRCETCEGNGYLCVEMHFLPDVYVPCDDCEGRRYNDNVLEVKLHGKSIADVLEMSCGDALELFAGYPKLARILQTLCDVGLDYVTLGQSAPTLSGGEAQRVKLASELARPMTGNTLYLLDEPTTGLHFDDIEKLLDVIQRLVDLGNTVVVVEHNLDVIKCADWIVDLGPGAGAAGGQIVFAGLPEQLVNSKSPTAPFLASALSTTAKPKQRSVSRRTKSTPQISEAAKEEPNSRSKPNQESKRSDATQPWQALGRRWHTLSKGFPEGQDPEWPLELVDRMLKLLEQVAGEESLQFTASDRVAVTPNGNSKPWVELATKAPESLKVTLAGPQEAIDEAALRNLDVTGPIETSDGDITKVTLNLTQLKHARSRKLRTFLKDHLERCDLA